MNLVLASDVIETNVEAFKEGDAIAAQETEQESCDLPWISRSLWSKEPSETEEILDKDSVTAYNFTSFTGQNWPHMKRENSDSACAADF